MEYAFLPKLANVLGVLMAKELGRAQMKDRILNQKQLVVVQHDHWMMDVLCRWTRDNHERLRNRLHLAHRVYVEALLDKRLDEAVESSRQAWRISASTVAVASFYSHQWPEFEPLLIEVALTECLATFPLNESPLNDPTDVDRFETFLHDALSGDRVDEWFNCQFFIDSVDMLALSPYFYRDRIPDKVLRNLISRCLVEGGGDDDARNNLLINRLTEKKHRAALEGWTTWLGAEIASVGWPRRSTGNHCFLFLHDFILNAAELNPEKPAYFPLAVGLRDAPKPFETPSQRAIITTKTTLNSLYFPRFIYFAPPPENQSERTRC